MQYKTLSIKRKGDLGILYLDRPDVLNALSETMFDELIHYMDQAASDDGLKILILTGKGPAFSAGGDLNMFKDAYDAFIKDGTGFDFGRTDLQRAFIDFPKPLIAAINGAAVGFGLTVSLTCDIRIAAEGATFNCAFARVGVTPEFGSSYFLPRLIGYAKAAELAMTARTIDAHEALRIGLVNRVVPLKGLLPESEKIAARISSLPTDAVRMTKSVLRYGWQASLDQALPYEARVFQQCSRSMEHYNAVCAALEGMHGRSKKDK